MRHLTLAVNISMRQFKSERLIDDVLAEGQKAGIDPEQLKLEITERLANDDFGNSTSKLCELQPKGFLISLNGLRAGNSSLNYLAKLPVNPLKIDKSFVDNLSVVSHQDSETARPSSQWAAAWNSMSFPREWKTKPSATFC
jgi:EAL domain-containing protein (putative c-di-GMP-specific phosphodiesterase class I)